MGGGGGGGAAAAGQQRGLREKKGRRALVVSNSTAVPNCVNGESVSNEIYDSVSK